MDTQWYITSFMLATLASLIVFTLARVPIMNEEHFLQVSGEKFHPLPDSLLYSVLVQSMVGSSNIIPVSMLAKTITIAQTLLMLVLGAIVIRFCMFCALTQAQ